MILTCYACKLSHSGLYKIYSSSINVLPDGFGAIPRISADIASLHILHLLYNGQPTPEKPVSFIKPLNADRDKVLYERRTAGERAVDLAKEFGISERRVNWLINR